MKKYFLVFAANFKDENPYLKEWLDYHILAGVDHFYLYDQDGGVAVKDILEPYVRDGYVSRFDWTHFDGTRYDGSTRFFQRNKNHMAFSHCAARYRHEFQWVMKIDIDEFLYPLDSNDSLLDWLRRIDVRTVKGCRIPRINFGSNGHKSMPGRGVLESYIRREPVSSNHKDLANSDFLTNNHFTYSAHWWRYKWFRPGLLLKKDIGWRVNHYYTKSEQEYGLRQNVSRGRPEGMAGFTLKNKGCNDVEDAGMLRFVSKMSQVDS